ncbi:hypothetical protein BVY03_04000 [bacterium K02(2017)]|nr:hypothetical protein BVY03_04000 [bacterium K02(2017)]
MSLCKLARVSRSGYYEWLTRSESKRAKENRCLLVAIKSSYNENRQAYGAIRIKRDLTKQGHTCSKNRVARLMSKNGLKSVHRAKYKPQTTKSDHKYNVSPNIIAQDFEATCSNQKWGCDISYIKTNEGWLYLAIVMDFYSRQIVGFEMSNRMHAELCCTALNKACLRRSPPAELIHHSDRGVQYASLPYRKMLQSHEFIQSMSRKGNCYDNSMVESFFHTLKVELVYRKKYETRLEAKQDITDYIYNFYNSKRMHSSLDYMSPMEFENVNQLAA